MTPTMASVSPSSFPMFPPVWAEVFGEDDFGIFAEFTLRKVRFVWRWIPPGRFLMGSPETENGRYDNESPQHWVTLSRGFWLGETPVTQAQWETVQKGNPSHFRGPELPVETVSWYDSQDFIRQLRLAVPGLDAELPTDAQWEYACRAGTTGAFHDGSPCTEPWGDDPALAKLGWFDDNSERSTHEVKQKAPNAWGVYDLHGNVWEWCLDRERSSSREPRLDPVGPMDEITIRAVRGGSWSYQARDCRAACRFRGGCGSRWDSLGLRLAAGQELWAAEPQGAERPSDRTGGSRG